MTEFKAGDRVRYEGHYWNMTPAERDAHRGATGTVMETPEYHGSGSNVNVKWDKRGGIGGGIPPTGVFQGNLEMMQEAPKPVTKPEYKIGDRVIMTKELAVGSSMGSRWKGITGTVVDTEGYEGNIRIKPDSSRPDGHGKSSFWVKPDAFKPLASEKKNFTISPPGEGKVTLELDWNDALVLSRVLGLANSASLSQNSPVLYNFVQSMVEHIGRAHESNDYAAYVYLGQVRIDPAPKV